MWTRALLKQNGKVAFQRNYWLCVAVCAMASFLGVSVGDIGFSFSYELNSEESVKITEEMLLNIPLWVISTVLMFAVFTVVIVMVITVLVSNVATVGFNRYFLENREHKTGIGQLFYAFQGGRYGKTVVVMFLRQLYVFGGFLLLIIPGIVKGYSYMLVPYILAENTNLDRKRVFELSEEMMNGHKMEAFVLDLSFLGWRLLGLLTAGLSNSFYVNPYIQATYAELYSALKAEALQKGILMEGELPGVGTVEM